MNVSRHHILKLLKKLDLAVSHMVEYVEDMTVYYGEVLSEREL